MELQSQPPAQLPAAPAEKKEVYGSHRFSKINCQ